jgi:hypothetical protein
MADEKKPGADKPDANAHTVETVKIDANAVRDLVSRSALTGAHDWFGPNARGFYECRHCGRRETSLPQDVLKSDCPRSPSP